MNVTKLKKTQIILMNGLNIYFENSTLFHADRKL